MLLILMLIPFWIDFLIRISAWVVLLGRNGLINSALTATILDEPARMLGTYGAVLVGMVYAFLPSAVFPIYAALQPIDRALLEAGRDLGAGPFQNFRRVTLPLSMPGVMAACLFVFGPSMGVFAIPVLLGGGTPFFTALDDWVNLTLVETRTFPDGVLLTRYETRC